MANKSCILSCRHPKCPWILAEAHVGCKCSFLRNHTRWNDPLRRLVSGSMYLSKGPAYCPLLISVVLAKVAIINQLPNEVPKRFSFVVMMPHVLVVVKISSCFTFCGRHLHPRGYFQKSRSMLAWQMSTRDVLRMARLVPDSCYH